MKRFWETVLLVNSFLIVCASVALVYSFGMLAIAFEWQRFVFVLTLWIVLVGMEMVFTGVLHT